MGSFELWQEMREEHEGEKILTLSLVLTTGGLVGVFLGVWGTTLGILGAWLRWSVKNRFNFWEGLDIIGRVGLGVGVIVSLGWLAWGMMAGLAIGSLLVSGLKKYYRRFKWYKSGRVGLVGLGAILWLGVVEVTVAKRAENGLYWGGLEVSQWIGIWVIIFCLITVYLRAGYRLWPKAIKKA